MMQLKVFSVKEATAQTSRGNKSLISLEFAHHDEEKLVENSEFIINFLLLQHPAVATPCS